MSTVGSQVEVGARLYYEPDEDDARTTPLEEIALLESGASVADRIAIEGRFILEIDGYPGGWAIEYNLWDNEDVFRHFAELTRNRGLDTRVRVMVDEKYHPQDEMSIRIG